MPKPILTSKQRRILADLLVLKLAGGPHAFTQTQIADMVGVGQKTVSRYERALKQGISRKAIRKYGVGDGV